LAGVSRDRFLCAGNSSTARHEEDARSEARAEERCVSNAEPSTKSVSSLDAFDAGINTLAFSFTGYLAPDENGDTTRSDSGAFTNSSGSRKA